MNKHTKEIIKRVNATLSLEGMPLTDEDKEFLALYIDGKISMDEAIAILEERFKENN